MSDRRQIRLGRMDRARAARPHRGRGGGGLRAGAAPACRRTGRHRRALSVPGKPPAALPAAVEPAMEPAGLAIRPSRAPIRQAVLHRLSGPAPGAGRIRPARPRRAARRSPRPSTSWCSATRSPTGLPTASRRPSPKRPRSASCASRAPTTGLIRVETRGESYDWPAAARDMLNAEKPDFVVMMLGIADRRGIRETIRQQPARPPAGQKQDQAKQAPAGTGRLPAASCCASRGRAAEAGGHRSAAAAGRRAGPGAAVGRGVRRAGRRNGGA